MSDFFSKVESAFNKGRNANPQFGRAVEYIRENAKVRKNDLQFDLDKAPENKEERE